MLKIDVQHVPLLKTLYQENRFPSDRLIRARSALVAFTGEFNRRCVSGYQPEHVAESLEYLRKSKDDTGGLPQLGRNPGGPKFN